MMWNRKERTTDTFGAQLAKLRIFHGLSQVDVATTSGISAGYYCAIESDKRIPPPMETLARILSALRCTEAETVALQEIAATERGLSQFDIDLPEEVQALIADLRKHGDELPSRFVHSLRIYIREAVD